MNTLYAWSIDLEGKRFQEEGAMARVGGHGWAMTPPPLLPRAGLPPAATHLANGGLNDHEGSLLTLSKKSVMAGRAGPSGPQIRPYFLSLVRQDTCQDTGVLRDQSPSPPIPRPARPLYLRGISSRGWSPWAATSDGVPISEARGG